ncbi:MAG: hypothetical protein IK069_01240, partial [Firmicutes bacterium]|nr:hypothetical protein [Bacillota bacterium]
IQGCVTNTRLMGVIAMHLEWEDCAIKANPHVHQYYYFDYEELGLETLKIMLSNDAAEVEKENKRCFAGLGADLMPLSEREARYLVCFMLLRTNSLGQVPPYEAADVKYISDYPPELSGGEYKALWDKFCVPVKSDYGIVNYYLMRRFGKDDEAAEYLISEFARKEDIEDVTPRSHSTFLYNKIESLAESAGNKKMYRCESLVEVESEARYSLVVSQVTVYKRRVLEAKLISTLAISVFEASSILNKTEYVTVYNVKENLESFANRLEDFSLGMTKTLHPTGEMYMEFMPDNDHAENKVFYLSDDVRALYYLSEASQLIVAAYGEDSIRRAEIGVFMSPLRNSVEAVGRFKFMNSILYDYAESGIGDFLEFLKLQQ